MININEYLTGEEILPPDQKRVKEQVKLAYCPLLCFWKTNKNDWRARKKQINPFTNQNKRLETLTRKDDHKSIYKEIFDKVVKKI